MYFRYFLIIFPLRRARPFIWMCLNPLHLWMLGDKFGWYWPFGSGEENSHILSNFNVFSLFHNYLPFEKSVVLQLKKWIPFTQGSLEPSLDEIGPVILMEMMNMWNVYRRTAPMFYIGLDIRYITSFSFVTFMFLFFFYYRSFLKLWWKRTDDE